MINYNEPEQLKKIIDGQCNGEGDRYFVMEGNSLKMSFTDEETTVIQYWSERRKKWYLFAVLNKEEIDKNIDAIRRWTERPSPICNP